jgi:hypothetical protein
MFGGNGFQDGKKLRKWVYWAVFAIIALVLAMLYRTSQG